MRIRHVSRLGAVVAVAAGLMIGPTANADPPPTLDTTASATESAVRLAPPSQEVSGGRSLLISDSAWLGMYLYGGGVDAVQGFDHTLALASCRRRVVTSCTNFDGYVPIPLLEELRNHPDGFTTLIVATGYNDDDRAFASELDTIITEARSLGYRRVVWLTLRSNVTYVSPDDAGFAEVFGNNNTVLARIVADGTYPELVMADWASYARDQPNWFSADGIHLRRTGGYAAADYISRKMTFLDRQPCAQPLVAGRAPDDRCPDPDVQGPIVDLGSLYPLDAAQPRVPFLLNFEGSSSWPDPPWWES
jgi:hypothetical protein